MSRREENDRIFKALASDVRRDILDSLRDDPQTTGALCRLFPDLSRYAVMQHLGVLEAAGLVIVRRQGRKRWNYLNALPIKDIHDRWIGPHAARAVDVLANVKSDLERDTPGTGKVETSETGGRLQRR
ncbi:ArsR/SmtB family transcription factor [Hyphobacterium marinum]|uniref:Metalloregulator ArsR/SmtB family transcription factor n=1 Tax=Hyphobacterium marinum TaxID=3116574 RepID=A0ABU7LZN5_9PROT|nr:metalloregulator ArsR/SmtB family transcription factor [Hyphobacterium sp. Y6023]MEE2567003.1 metalloregulator ArsR/SmtB family transcription factor [Hyphobacterium sp. Y6023]